VAVGFADEQKVRAHSPDRFAYGLFRIDVVARIDRIETAVTGGVAFEPTAQRSAFTILFVVTLLRFDEFRPWRQNQILARFDDALTMHAATTV
jgi:hypothetical protein